MRAIPAVTYCGTRDEWQRVAVELRNAKHTVTARNIESLAERPDYYYLTGTTGFDATDSTIVWIREAAERAGIEVKP